MRSKRLRLPARGLALALLGLALGGCAGAPEGAAPTALETTPWKLRSDAASIVQAGEECVYGVAWSGFIPVGRVIYRTRAAEAGAAPAAMPAPTAPLLVYEGRTEPLSFVAAFLDAGGTTEVHVDPATLLPWTAFWITANPEKPVTRTAWFDRTSGETLTAKSEQDSIKTRTVRSPGAMDPLSAIYLARAIDFASAGGEVRFQVVEGIDLHLMTLRVDGDEEIVQDGRKVACMRLVVQTHRLDGEGKTTSDEPENSIFAWIADEPGRPIVRMSGQTVFGKVSLRLAKRTRDGDSHGT